MDNNVYSRTMQKAVQLAGGTKQLARKLHVPMAELEKWLAGKGVPPKQIFLQAVDMVLEETSASGAEPADAPPPRDCAGVGGSSAQR